MRKLTTFGRYYRRRLGRRVKKIPISLSGFTCPNIDGTVARGGCVYCQNESFSPNVSKTTKAPVKLNLFSDTNPLLEQQKREITEQYRDYLETHRLSFKKTAFLIYFQAFTNTYAPLETLRVLYEHALSLPGVVGLSIGTRTDSINEPILEYLAGLSHRYEIWLEFGVQSVYDSTLEKINRGHDFHNIQNGIAAAHHHGLKVCAHLIYGLPGEDRTMMLNSLKKCLLMGVESLKFHPLYVVEKTALANDFKEGKFVPIEEDAYLDLVAESVSLLPPQVVVQRLSAGTSDDSLLAPAWCSDKNRLIQKLRIKLATYGIAL